MSQGKKKNIAFFHPSFEFGGAELLVIRMTKELISNGYEITIIDYRNGKVISGLADTPEIGFVEYLEGKKFELRNSTYLVSFSLWIEAIKNQLIAADIVKLLIWCIHPIHIFYFIKPLQTYQAYYLNCFHRRKISKLLNIMHLSGSLKFMDYENFFIAKDFFKLSFKPDYLPIPVIFGVCDEEKHPEEGMLSLVWIGRLSTEKVNTLLFALDQVRLYSNKNHIVLDFYIVGTGLAGNLLDEYINENKFNFINLIRINSLLPEKLTEFLSGKDLLFAMGTTALEGGAAKIPTILLDYSPFDYKRIIDKGYKYKWLFQSKDFKVGSNIFKSHKFLKEENHLTIDNIFDSINDPAQKETIAVSCYNYSITNHHMGIVTGKFLSNLENCDFTANDLITFDLDKNKMEISIDRAYIHYKKLRAKFSARL